MSLGLIVNLRRAPRRMFADVGFWARTSPTGTGPYLQGRFTRVGKTARVSVRHILVERAEPAPRRESQSLGGLQGGGVASLHRPVRASRFPAPVLSSLGALVTQLDISQAAASTRVNNFIGGSQTSDLAAMRSCHKNNGTRMKIPCVCLISNLRCWS
jgi:hypothetical protein